MKYAFYIFVMLLFAGVAEAQSQATTGVIRGYVADQFVVDVQQGANTIFERDGVRFTIEMTIEDDSTLSFSRPQVEGQKRGYIQALVKKGRTSRDKAAEIICPSGFEAEYVSDEAGAYEMGYCERAKDRSDPWLGDYFPGVSISLPFSVIYPEDR